METKYKREHALVTVLLMAMAIAYAYYGVIQHAGLLLGFYAMYRYDLRLRIEEARMDAVYMASYRRTKELLRLNL
jgi:hypothetical protein